MDTKLFNKSFNLTIINSVELIIEKTQKPLNDEFNLF